MPILGLRSAVKEDLQCSSAELVYKQTLRVPGELFTSSDENIDKHLILINLRKNFNKLRPNPVHSSKKTLVFLEMENTEYGFHKLQGIKAALKPYYEGHIKVISKSDKLLIIFSDDKKLVVNINHLKTAFLFYQIIMNLLKKIKVTFALSPLFLVVFTNYYFFFFLKRKVLYYLSFFLVIMLID